MYQDVKFTLHDNNIVYQIPKQRISKGAGSHSPFSIHVDEMIPSSAAPGGQWKVTVVPSIAGGV